MRPPREDTEPWYKQFWPWFLIALPLSVVIAALVTINIAIETDDGLVSDDYYKEGLAIHKDAESAARATALGISALVSYDADTGAITLSLDKPLAGAPTSLHLEVTHPTKPDQDQKIQLVTHPTKPDQDQKIQLAPVSDVRFAGRLEPLGPANWKLALRPADRSWRVDGRLAQPGNGEARLD